jgi:hypothetical protein
MDDGQDVAVAAGNPVPGLGKAQTMIYDKE